MKFLEPVNKKDKYKAIIRVETLDCDPILEEFKKRGYDIESVLTVASMDEWPKAIRSRAYSPNTNPFSLA